MITYQFLQQYWWCVVSLLGALLVFLMFVQGANSMLAEYRHDETATQLLLNSTGRKWEITFTTLVTFGGAFFASFPLFYSTSFGGAYWLWMLLLVTFVLQAVSYEFRSRSGNLLGRRVYTLFLVVNGILAPFLVGVVVSTFFNGAEFVVDRSSIADTLMPVISRWSTPAHGLEAIITPAGLLLGMTLVFLTRSLGCLYVINNVSAPQLTNRLRHSLMINAVPFVLLFVTFTALLLTRDGYAVDRAGRVFMQPYKYTLNLIDMPWVAGLFLVGVVLVLYGIWRSIRSTTYYRGIWPAGIGTILTVFSLLLLAGLNNTAYYPSLTDPACSLTIYNSSASPFTLEVMSVVSLLVPVVAGYIAYCWYSIDKRRITTQELSKEEHKY